MSDVAWRRAGLGVLLLQAVLLLNGAWRVGPTYDEHFYAAAGVAYLKDGELGLNREHPPLLKYLAGLPLVIAGVDYPERALQARNYPVAFFYQRNAEHIRRNLFLARVPFCLLTITTSVLIWWAARKRFGPAAAVGGMALFALNPSVLAHGRLVSLDAGVTPFFFAAVLAFLAALERPAWKRTLVAALFFGLAHLAKFTALLLGPAFVGLAIVAALRSRKATPLATLAGTLLGGFGVFCLGYGFEAKSLNEAWGSEYFVRDIPPRAVTPAELAEALKQAGADANDVARIAGANLGAAVNVLVGALDDPTRAPLAAEALRAMEGGPGELRKSAFARVLALPVGRLEEDERHATLAALSGRSAPDLQGWRTFYTAEEHESWDKTLLYHGWMESLTAGVFGHARPIPLLTALKGLDQTLAHGKIGHRSYFRGKTLMPGRDFAEGNPHPEYYAVVMAVKNPLAWLALVLLGLGLAFRPGREPSVRGWTLLAALALLGIPLLMFLAFSNGRALLGVRYLIPLYPFAALLGARAFAALPRTAFALGGVMILESLWIHPHELLYYNVLAGGPAGGPEITVVGDDWGQDVSGVGAFYARYRTEIDAAGGLFYRPYSMADPAAFGLGGARPPVAGARGIVAVHAVDYYREAEEFAWLRGYEPFLSIGHAVYVYDTREGEPGGDPLGGWEANR